MLRILLLVVTALRASVTLQEDYYWREYTGTIPEDAIVGGRDINKKNVYIGQAYYHCEGLVVVEIFPGVREVHAPMGGKAKSIDSHIKILCGSQQNFHWFPVNATQLHLQTIDKHPVIGGHQTQGVLYIGRINYESGIKIGKVAPFYIQNSLMFFNDKGVERFVGSYEVLLYNDNDGDIDVRIKRNK